MAKLIKEYSQGNTRTRILVVNEDTKQSMFLNTQNNPKLNAELKKAGFKKTTMKGVKEKAIYCFCNDYETETVFAYEIIDYLQNLPK